MRIEGEWFKSLHSHGGAEGSCVSVKSEDQLVMMRDSKLGDDSPELGFTAHEWDAFIKGVKDGEFDLPEDLQKLIEDPDWGGGPLVNPGEFQGHIEPGSSLDF